MTSVLKRRKKVVKVRASDSLPAVAPRIEDMEDEGENEAANPEAQDVMID
jgi:hypothetical protein